jgi:hypothetical protein
MVERSRFWDGSATGDAVSITDDELMDRFFRSLLNGTGNQGVLRGWLNELEVTDGGGLNASVDTGGAIVYGGWYENDASATVVLPNNSTVWVVVRRSWAASTSRLTQVAALVQNPTVTYDIPLAQVTTLAGAITLIVDSRDYCEFTTEMLDGAVGTDAIQADAVTTAKLENQTRWITRGYGELIADVTNPATLASTGDQGEGEPYNELYRPYWSFTDGVSDAAWATFQVPADISGATMSIYFWTGRPNVNYGYATQMRWEYSLRDAPASGVLGTQTGAATISYPAYKLNYDHWAWRYCQRDLIGTLAGMAAGDIIHLQAFRVGAHAGDTYPYEGALFMVEITYTADS